MGVIHHGFGLCTADEDVTAGLGLGLGLGPIRANTTTTTTTETTARVGIRPLLKWLAGGILRIILQTVHSGH